MKKWLKLQLSKLIQHNKWNYQITLISFANAYTKSFNNQFSRLGSPNKLMEIDKISADLHTKEKKLKPW
jgi:hypothetical protein